MNSDIQTDIILFDSRRLEKLMRLWRNPGDTASPVFLAMNILDFSGRLYRHLVVHEGDLEPETATRCREVLDESAALITGDPEIAAQVFDNICFEPFDGNLRQFTERFDSGELIADELEDAAADLVDHYFSLDLVLETAERTGILPEKVSMDFDHFRQSFSTAISENPDLADAVRDFAEAAPGGPDMHPWPGLLEKAPDRLFDAVWASAQRSARIDPARAQVAAAPAEVLTAQLLEFRFLSGMPLAADDGLTKHPDQTVRLLTLPEIDIALCQYNDIMVISITGDDLDALPVPRVMKDGTEISIKPVFEKRTDAVHHRVGTTEELDGQTLTIDFPGLNLPVLNIPIKCDS